MLQLCDGVDILESGLLDLRYIAQEAKVGIDFDIIVPTGVTVGGMRFAQRLMLPQEQSDVLEVPLQNEGRVFSLKIENEENKVTVVFG